MLNEKSALETPTYRLENVEAIHRQHPRTFSIPRSEIRGSLKQGMLVKLIFLLDAPTEEGIDAERMWVQVHKVVKDFYWGLLDNDPRYVTSLKSGDLIEFRPEHVAAIYAETGSPGWIDESKLAIVSRDVLENEAWPGRLVRTEPPDNQFSGWWILSGQESEEGMQRSDNFQQSTLFEMIRRFRVLDSVLDESGLATWTWDEQTAEYRRQASNQNDEIKLLSGQGIQERQ